jgi:lysozyme family protein
MSDFDIALTYVLENEGGYSNVSGDSGGETYRGISRNNFPEWRGWAILDELQQQGTTFYDEEIIKNTDLDMAVREFYYKIFWTANDLNYIKDNEVAKKIMDMCVNMGSREGIELAQRALDDLGISVNEDGKMGPVTYNAINSLDPIAFYNQLKKRSVEFYQEVVQHHPGDKKFLSDWLERANK